MIKKLFFGLTITLLLSSCASILSGTTQSINVRAVDAVTNELLDNVRCTLQDVQGIVYVIPSNPGSALVTRGKGALTPMCKKQGYKQVSYAVGESFNATTLVNLLFWPGFLVDVATGAAHQYPSHINVLLEKK